ncbi:AAA family ATPase [Xanthomonas perforans]
MQHPAFYVTGTDTGIGKTMGSTALLHALRARGHRRRWAAVHRVDRQ